MKLFKKAISIFKIQHLDTSMEEMEEILANQFDTVARRNSAPVDN